MSLDSNVMSMLEDKFDELWEGVKKAGGMGSRLP